MRKPGELSAAEVIVTAGLIGLFALVWVKYPSIKVSSETLESYDLSDARQPAWRNGVGLSISARFLPDEAAVEAAFPGFGRLAEDYLAFAVTVKIDGASYPTMVDLPYERMRLADAAGGEHAIVNPALFQQTEDAALKRLLEIFDWSIVNNTFTRQDRAETGLLLFERGGWRGEPLSLRVNVYHHPYKQVDLTFPFNDGAGPVPGAAD